MEAEVEGIYMFMMNKRKTGFTLVEVMIVIAILGLLVAIVAPAIMKAKEKTENHINYDKRIERFSKRYGYEMGDVRIFLETYDFTNKDFMESGVLRGQFERWCDGEETQFLKRRD